MRLMMKMTEIVWTVNKVMFLVEQLSGAVHRGGVEFRGGVIFC